MIKLIQLRPLGEFFFGGESTFGQGLNQHYYVRSNLLPQQTALLGLLRHELLKSEPKAFDLKTDSITTKEEAGALVGLQGFDGTSDHAYGIIDGISPVMLLNENGTPFFLHTRLALAGCQNSWLEKKSEDALAFQFENLLASSEKKQAGYQLMCKRVKKGNTVVEPYDDKTDFEEMLIDASGQLIPLHYDPEEAPNGVFIRVPKTGNRKNYSGASDESGFYKQDMFKLRNGWSFAFLAAFNAGLPAGFGIERNTNFGAERRPFRLNVSDPGQAFAGINFVENAFQNLENLFSSPHQAPPGLSQVVLLSDASATAALYDQADFAITETIPFRHLLANLRNPNSLWNAGHEPKSRRYNLLRRASVLFTQSPQAIETQLAAALAFRRIGYNYFKTITNR